MLSVYSAGHIPGGYVTNHIYTWVDPQGRSISPPSGLPQPHGSALRQHEGDRRSTLHLLQGGDEKKVSCLAVAGTFLGGGVGLGEVAVKTPSSLPDPHQGSFLEPGRRALLLSGLWPSSLSLSQVPAEGFSFLFFLSYALYTTIRTKLLQ